jgi:hypothetical protein
MGTHLSAKRRIFDGSGASKEAGFGGSDQGGLVGRCAAALFEALKRETSQSAGFPTQRSVNVRFVEFFDELATDLLAVRFSSFEKGLFDALSRRTTLAPSSLWARPRSTALCSAALQGSASTLRSRSCAWSRRRV